MQKHKFTIKEILVKGRLLTYLIACGIAMVVVPVLLPDTSTRGLLIGFVLVAFINIIDEKVHVGNFLANLVKNKRG